ncbi:hypothetical protein CYLTODRAFT_485083 [Cylindrobasidium torrendii FP15055 ss-10]|uniref:AttH domain-containing protein n=1 Tax=Cylindrobasidium torrendii FP15055 ss-10 TaxID=1314674 RepID=A0A0D7BUT6_9AGAR|nr:hypothetical protein CYLTODRAFT_485083 [Cylindrobasidium torrendii FP15055 ss-10]
MSSFISAFLLVGAALAASSSVNIPGTVSSGDSTALWTSLADSFDGPKISAVTSSSFDWWYFDAVSDDGQSSVVVTFFTSTSSAFPFLVAIPNVTPVYVWTMEGTDSNVWLLQADSASVVTVGDGASGAWTGSGASFEGNADMSTYSITLDAADNGISGTISLSATAPAHYPCSPASVGQSMEVLPGVGWANAVPDARATIDLSINGKAFSFTGSGYHDKNWSDEPFDANVDVWLWGRGSLGDYTVVWFDAIDTQGNEHASAYVALNGQIVGQSCETTTVKVRGTGVAWPPTGEEPEAFHVDIDLGAAGVFSIDAKTETVIGGAGGSSYTRWSGSLSGSVNGSGNLTGVGIFDQILS